MGFFSLSHFVSQFPPTRFPLLTAIGMCYFLPVHHLEWHFGPGRKSKYNTCTCIGFHPGRVELASSRASTAYWCLCCSLKKILWDLIKGRVPSPIRKKTPCLAQIFHRRIDRATRGRRLPEETPPGFSPVSLAGSLP